MKRTYLLSLIVTVAVTTYAAGQGTTTTYNLADLYKNGKLQAVNRDLVSITDHDRPGIQFSEKAGEGLAWLEGVTFANGTIELDIKGKDVLQRSFVGVAFHGQDDKTFDAVYFRPFNFITPDPIRRIHAVQYIAHPDFPWKRLRDEQNGKYEKPVVPVPDPNQWFHAKIVVDYPHVQVFVNNSSEPSLSVDQLNGRTQGKLGLWVGEGSGGDFANLTITRK